MINYIGHFNDIEKEYIEKYIHNDSICIKTNPYAPFSSINEIEQYIKLLNKSLPVVFFNKRRKKIIENIVTPAIFSSNLLNVSEEKRLLSEDFLVYIQQGCSENCICTSAYKCKFSVPFKDIKQQIKELSQQKYISLYGINVGDYNYNNMKLIDLCKQVLDEFPDSKIILCNISPFSPYLSDIINYIKFESRIIPVLYLCVNSGSQKILDIEGHKNVKNDLVSLLKDTNIRIVPYLIVGSPEETKQDFEDTIKWVEYHRDILLGAIILPYTANGIGNCNQTITDIELINRLIQLNKVVFNNSITYNNTELSIPLLKNIIETAICGEDHEFYKKYLK